MINKIEKLLGQEEAISGASLRLRIVADDLTETTAATAQVIELFDVSKGDIVQLVGAYLETSFDDSSDAAFNSTAITIGDGVDADRYLTSSQINTNGAAVTSNAGTGVRFAYTADDTVDATISAMTAKSLADIDNGSIVLLFKRINLKDLRG